MAAKRTPVNTPRIIARDHSVEFPFTENLSQLQRTIEKKPRVIMKEAANKIIVTLC